MSDSMATGPRNPSYTDAVKAPALRQEPSTSTALIDSQPGGAHRGAYGSTADGSTATLSPLSNKTSRQGSQHGVSRSSSRGVIPVDGASGQAGSLLGHKYEDENEGVVDESNVSRCGPLDSMPCDWTCEGLNCSVAPACCMMQFSLSYSHWCTLSHTVPTPCALTHHAHGSVSAIALSCSRQRMRQAAHNANTHTHARFTAWTERDARAQWSALCVSAHAHAVQHARPVFRCAAPAAWIDPRATT